MKSDKMTKLSQNLPQKRKINEYLAKVNPELLSKIMLRDLETKEFKKENLVKELQSVFKRPRPIYSQNWNLYYKNTRTEKLMFLTVLKCAVDYLNISQKYKWGRPTANMSDIIKGLMIMVYHNYSTWRVESELKICRTMGVLDYYYKRSTLNNYLSKPEVNYWLHELYKILAEPLVQIESVFAADATGISTFQQERWINVRNKRKLHKKYIKLHILSGVVSNVVTSARISEGTKNDSPFLKELMDDTSKTFNIKEVVADAGYLSRKNCDVVAEAGATPFIMPKKNIRKIRNYGTSGAWGKMIRLWKNYRELFLYHYHQRSNVESTFSTIKRRFGFYVRTKKPLAQKNEILLKICCHNACTLCKALVSFDVKPAFMVT